MFRHWHSALQPCRVPEIEQHLRSRSQPLSREIERLGSALAGEASRLVQRIDFVHQSVRLPEVNNVAGEGILDPLRALHQSREIGVLDVGGYVCGLELRVDFVLRRISVRIRPHPAVVLNGCVQGLRSISHVVSQPARIENNRLLHRCRRLMRRPPLPIFPERSLQAAIHFHRDIRLQPDAFRKVVVGMVRGRGSLLVQLAIELIQPRRQRIEPRDAFQIDEVVGLLRILQSEFGRTAPPIRLRPKISDLKDRASQKSRHVRRNLLRRHAVDVSVSLVPPSPRPHTLQDNEGRQPQTDQPPSKPPSCHFTMQSSVAPQASNQNAKCSESCRKRGLPIVCWMTPKLPSGGIDGGPTKLGKKLTSLLGVSKSGWLKILNASASNLSWKRSLNRNCLAKLVSKRTWNGPRKLFRPVVPNNDSKSSQPVASQAGTPLVPGATNWGPKSATLSLQSDAETPTGQLAPLAACLAVTPGSSGTMGLPISLSVP